MIPATRPRWPGSTQGIGDEEHLGGVHFADMVKGNKVLPWMRDEYIQVDGFELVYTAHKGKEEELCVHMPGGRRETVESLRKQGFVVSMPKLMRFFGAL